MTGFDVLTAAAELAMGDEHYRAEPDGERSWLGFWNGRVRDGGGIVMALRRAAGRDTEAYNEAYAVLSEYCDRNVPLTPRALDPARPKYSRGREHGELREWAIGKTDDQRRALLRQAAFKLAGGL